MARGASVDTRCSCAVSEPDSHVAWEFDAQCESQMGGWDESPGSARSARGETVVMDTSAKDGVPDVGGAATSRIGNENRRAADGDVVALLHSGTI